MSDAPLPISCYIITKNEGDRVARALESVRGLCAETVIVDSGSEDDTLLIAKSFGARIIHRDWPNSFGDQKRFAEDQCEHDWLLNLDADEWLSRELQDEIRSLFQGRAPARPVWRIAVKDAFFGEASPRPSRRAWHKNSLYNRKYARMSERRDHAGVPSARGRLGRLKHSISHNPARSLAELVQKQMRYAADAARDPKSRAVLLARIVLETEAQFLKSYILHRDFRFGLKGYIYAIIRASGRFFRIAQMLEAREAWRSARPPAPTEPTKPIAKSEAKALPISCFIITKNEEDRIGYALQSVYGLCADIVIVDSGSEDETIEIAKRFGARIIHRDWPHSFGDQKRFAQGECRYDYVLNLDADEWLSEEMAASIRETFQDKAPRETAWETPRYEVFPGAKSPWAFAKGWTLIRLYDRRHVGFSERYVGDAGVGATPDKTKRLRGRLLHAPIRSIAHLLEKENFYSSEEASIAKSMTALRLRIFTEFPLHFLKIYFARRFIFGGVQGFTMAMIYSFSRFLRIAKKIERQKSWALPKK